MTFVATSKLLGLFCKVDLGKVRVDGLSGSRQKIDIRHEFDFKLILKDLLTSDNKIIFISRQRH